MLSFFQEHALTCISLRGNKNSVLSYLKSIKRNHSDFHVLFGMLQSNVCVKQLSYAMLEQAVVTIFPELRQLIDDIHEKGRKEQASFTYQL
jgi:sorting nexin-13